MKDNALIGMWKLKSISRVDPQTKRTSEPWGTHPKGYITYLASGRMMVIFSHEKQTVPVGTEMTTAEWIARAREAVAYAGTYMIDGDKVIHYVEVSTIVAYIGTKQIRPFKIDGNTVSLFSAVTGQTLTWERFD